MEERVTKPTIETVLERMNAMEEHLGSRISASEERVGARIDALDGRFNAFEGRFNSFEGRFNLFEEDLGSRLDRIESLAHKNRAETLELRADFRDFRAHLKEHFPVPG